MNARFLHALSLMATTLLCGCAGDETANNGDSNSSGAPGNQPLPRQASSSYEICGQSMTADERDQLFQGVAFIAAGHRQYGFIPADAAVAFAVALIKNGIDFGALGSGRPDFVDGAYVFRNGDAMIGVRFLLTQDVGKWKAGTVLSHDILTPESFFSGLRLETKVNWSLTHPSLDASVEFVPGPLFDLVRGDIKFNGVVPTKAKLRLRTDAIAIELVTRQSYSFAAPHERDELSIVLNSTPITLDALEAALSGEGLGLVMSGTHFYAESYHLDQLFTTATFRIGEVGEGTTKHRAISGPYEAVLKAKELPLYQVGWAHTIEGNWADFYCDAEHRQLAGHAEHNWELTGGTFHFPDGSAFDYRLQTIPSLSDRTR